MASPQDLLDRAAPTKGSKRGDDDGLVRHFLYSKSDIEKGIVPGIYRKDTTQPDNKRFVDNLTGYLHDLRIGVDEGNPKYKIEPHYYLEPVIAVKDDNGDLVPVLKIKFPFGDQLFGDFVNRLLGGNYDLPETPISISLYASKKTNKDGNPYASLGVTEEAYTQKGYEWKYRYDEVPTKAENPRTGDDDWRPVRIFWIKALFTELLPMFNGDGAIPNAPRHPKLVSWLKEYMDEKLSGKTPAGVERFLEDMKLDFKYRIRNKEDLAEVKKHFDDLYVAAGGKKRLMGSDTSSPQAETKEESTEGQIDFAKRMKKEEEPPTNFPPASAEPQPEADDDLPF